MFSFFLCDDKPSVQSKIKIVLKSIVNGSSLHHLIIKIKNCSERPTEDISLHRPPVSSEMSPNVHCISEDHFRSNRRWFHFASSCDSLRLFEAESFQLHRNIKTEAGDIWRHEQRSVPQIIHRKQLNIIKYFCLTSTSTVCLHWIYENY